MRHLYSNAEEIYKKILKKSWLEGFVTPDYDEYCISNIPATILETFGISHNNGNSLINPELKSVLDDVNRVILLIVDSLGYQQILNALTEHNSILDNSIDKAILFPLTEVGILFNLKYFPTIAPNLPSLCEDASILIFFGDRQV